MEAHRHALIGKGVEWQKIALQSVEMERYHDALDAARKASSLLPDSTQLSALVTLLEEKVALLEDEGSSQTDDGSSGADSTSASEESGSSGDDSGDSSELSAAGTRWASGGASRSLTPELAEDAMSKLALAGPPSESQHITRLSTEKSEFPDRQKLRHLRRKLADGLEAVKEKAAQI